MDAGGQVMVVTPDNRVGSAEGRHSGLETADRVEVRRARTKATWWWSAAARVCRPGQEVQPKLTAMSAVKE